MMGICANPNESRVPTLEWASEVVSRYPIIFGAEGSQMFGWIHTRVESVAGAGVLICSPIGIEYIQSHRSVRHLADQLAEAGFPTMRFDYPGCGDSAQTEFDDDRVATWVKSIEIAATTLRERTGCSKVALVGIRFGASLASLAASRVGAEWLVLWNPVINGRHYVREMRALAMAARHRAVQESDLLEVAGFAYTPQTVLDIAAIDLLSLEFPTLSEALILERDDLASDSANFTSNLGRQGVRHKVVRVPGYANMMTEAQYSEVPRTAMGVVVQWLKHVTPKNTLSPSPLDAWNQPRLEANGVYEEPVLLGNGTLFGVLTRPHSFCAEDKPIILIPSSGSDHHVGPGRLNVIIARELASNGFSIFRFDLSGLGDSATKDSMSDNQPYTSTAVDDIFLIVNELPRYLLCSRFIIMGLCSGGYHAFRAALQLGGRVSEVVMINPLTFYWGEDDSLARDWFFMEAIRYRTSIRQLDSWRKIFRLELNFRPPAKAVAKYIKIMGSAYVLALAEAVRFAAPGQISEDVRELKRLGTRLVLIVASQDPGLEIFLATARQAARSGMRNGSIIVYRIPDSDHSFTTHEARCRLIEQIHMHLHPSKFENLC